MSDLVRVRVPGATTNVGRAWAESHGLEVVDEPTHNPDGTVRKPVLTAQKKAAITRAKAEPTEDAPEPKKPEAKPVETVD